MSSEPASSASPTLGQVYKDAIVPRRFSNDPFDPILPHSLRVPAQTPVVPQAEASSHLHTPCKLLIPPKDMTRPVRKYSLDASAVLSHRPSDRASNLDNDAGEALDVPGGRRPPGHAKTLDAGSLLPSSKSGQPTYYTSSPATAIGKAALAR